MNNKLIIDTLDDEKQVDIEVGRDETLVYFLLGIDKNKSKDIHIHLNGQGATAKILGVIIGDSAQTSIHTHQHHLVPDTQSDLLIKSVIGGSGKLTYDGLIKIEKGAQRSNAYQRNENIILSDKAHVDTKPELEILANDVRCTHGATVGKLDTEGIFYLQSRGINKEEAQKLMLTGFFESVIDQICDVNEQEKLRKKVNSALQTLMVL